MMNIPFVNVVILTWNHLKDTIECLDSVYVSDYPNYRIVIVDNASTDSTVEYVKENYSQVKIIQNPENLGYAEGNNVGIRYSLDHKTDYIFILNNDTVIQPDTIRLLVEDLETNPQAIAVAPKSYYYDNPEKVYFAGGKINPDGTVAHIKNDITGEGYETDWLNGCAIMFRTKSLHNIGTFDSKYYLLFEDTDWSIRARQSGYSLRIVPQTIIRHKSSSSFNGKWTSEYLYYYSRNRLLFHKKNFSFINRMKVLFYDLRYDLKMLRDKRWSTAERNRRYLVVRLAYRDFILSRFSRRNYRWPDSS